MERATFAAGCFWHAEEAFRNLDGILSTQVGYTGGRWPAPTYQEICSGQTGHAEAVRITFDPEVMDYQQLLDIFWSIHDPTVLNRQKSNVGTQYRSAIFYTNPRQKALAVISKARREKLTLDDRPIVTEIAPESTFYPAEEYHQHYYQKRRTYRHQCYTL
jgi:peptide-methionine (S)-S-oxide reductase